MVDYKHPDLGTRAVWSGESEYPAWVAAPSRAVRAFEEKIASLEGAPAALGFGTGKAAVAVTLLALLEPGDTLVSVQGPWGPVPAPLLGYLGRIGVRVELCRTAGTEDLIRKIVLGCKAVYLESPTTPELRVLDLALLSKAARKAGALVVADNTLATPVNQTPLGLGADLVIHSGVRLLSGQAGSLGGAVCGPPGLITKISGQREIMGAVLHPKEAPLLLGGMKTLHLRVARQNRSALALAHWLEDRDQVERVFYPGLPGDPGHGQAEAQMRGFGGLLAFTLKGGPGAAERFMERLRYARPRRPMEAVETAAASPNQDPPPAEADPGLPQGLVCYSVGIEDVEDLRADLAEALGAMDQAGEKSPPAAAAGPPRIKNPFEELYAFLGR